MPNLRKAAIRDRKARRRKHGMRVSGAGLKKISPSSPGPIRSFKGANIGLTPRPGTEGY